MRAYDAVCAAAQSTGKGRPGYSEIRSVISRLTEVMGIPMPADNVLRSAYSEFKAVKSSRALGF